jgi:PhnB protein
MSKVSYIPSGYRTVTCALALKDADRALEFYARAFGAEQRMRLSTPDGKVAHAEMQIGDSIVMLSEALRDPVTSASLYLYVPNVDEVVARAGAAGAQITMPPTDMFWGDRFGRVTDPFGVRWDIATHTEDLSPRRSAAGRRRRRSRRDSGGKTMSATRHGFLVLADISGFTEFVTTTELEHGPLIIAALLEEVIHRISPPLEVRAIEGDAVFALGPHGNVLPPAKLLDVLHEGFVGFREKQRELEQDDSCSCNACSNVARLRLKAIGHYGSFLEHTIGGRAQTAGADVILVHRLLKNGLAQKADYALLTRPALQYMEVDPGHLGLVPHTERYDHFGDVECFVRDVSSPG